jgi:hypothetical protein
MALGPEQPTVFRMDMAQAGEVVFLPGCLFHTIHQCA